MKKPKPEPNDLRSLFRLRHLHSLERETDSLIKETESLTHRVENQCGRRRSTLRANIMKLEEEVAELPAGQDDGTLGRLSDLHKQLDEELPGCPSDRVPGSEDDE